MTVGQSTPEQRLTWISERDTSTPTEAQVHTHTHTHRQKADIKQYFILTAISFTKLQVLRVKDLLEKCQSKLL